MLKTEEKFFILFKQCLIFAKNFIIKKTIKMKKIKILALALIATAITFTSCKKDEETKGPTLTVTESPVSGWLGDTVTFSYSISSNAKIKKLTWNADLAGVTTPDAFEITEFNGNYSATGTVRAILPSDSLVDGSTIKFSFTAEDKDGVEFATTKELTFAVEAPEQAMTDTQTGEINNLIGPNPGAWDLVSNAAVSANEDNADKDMINTTTLSSTPPETFETEWIAGNTTMYVQDNSFDYDGATVEGAMAAYAAGTATSTVSGVTTGNVYIAKLRGGDDYAVIKIINVIITDNDNLDKIEFSYKK